MKNDSPANSKYFNCKLKSQKKIINISRNFVYLRQESFISFFTKSKSSCNKITGKLKFYYHRKAGRF
nr:hypothetical protein 1634Bnrm1_p110 [Cryptomonas sp.]